MSKLVGMMLHNALHEAGHDDFHTVYTGYNLYKDEIMVRFDRGSADKRECVNFAVPNHLFDPVAYAKNKWPEWFGKRGQLDLFTGDVT